jgi:uncharacterized OsmC-like protein
MANHVWGLSRDAILFGLLACIPVTLLAITAAQLQRFNSMKITVTYDSGTTEVYTSCSNYSNFGVVVTFTGTDASGAVREWEINWAKVKKIEGDH